MVGRKYYGKSVLYSLFLEAFGERLKKDRKQFRSTCITGKILGPTGEPRFAVYLEPVDYQVRQSSAIPHRIMEGE
jgi:hypothetical protein